MDKRKRRLLCMLEGSGQKSRWISGVPPLQYSAKKQGTLKNYRIYGNTQNGKSVGDRTENLFDGSFIHRSVIIEEVSDDNPNRRSIVIDVSSYSNGNKITFSRETSAGNMLQMYQVTSPLKGGRLLNTNVVLSDPNTLLATITLDNISNYPYLMIFLNGATSPISDETLLASKIMVNVGDTSLPYEPYGYKVPVTVEGKNLFDEEYLNIVPNTVKYKTLTVNNGDYTLSTSLALHGSASIFLIQGEVTSGASTQENGVWSERSITITVTDNKMTIGYRVYSDEDPRDAQTMLNSGSTPLPYEPYRSPVTTNLYLPEQIRKVGEEAEYIDYGEQKQHRIGADDIDVTLPALPTLTGTNVLSVGTAVQPSEIEVKGKIKAL